MERNRVFMGFRFDPRLRERLKAEAERNFRTLNREAEYRLEQSLAAEGKQSRDQIAA